MSLVVKLQLDFQLLRDTLLTSYKLDLRSDFTLVLELKERVVLELFSYII